MHKNGLFLLSITSSLITCASDLEACALIYSGGKLNKSKQLPHRHLVQIKTTNNNGGLMVLILVNVLLIKGKSINDKSA